MAHDWQNVALGRICRECGLVQAKDEFDDEPECPVADGANGDTDDSTDETAIGQT